MEESRETITELDGINDGLLHSFGYIEFFHPLALYMDTMKPGHIRNSSISLRASPGNRVSVSVQDFHKLLFAVSTFSLL
jgi:hypothetical protein